MKYPNAATQAVLTAIAAVEVPNVATKNSRAALAAISAVKSPNATTEATRAAICRNPRVLYRYPLH